MTTDDLVARLEELAGAAKQGKCSIVFVLEQYLVMAESDPRWALAMCKDKADAEYLAALFNHALPLVRELRANNEGSLKAAAYWKDNYERLRAELAETAERCKFLSEANDALLEKGQLEKSALVDELRAELAEANGWFKNFHRLLCERFGYTHDEVDWQRDQLSLIEFIAAQLSEAKRDAAKYGTHHERQLPKYGSKECASTEDLMWAVGAASGAGYSHDTYDGHDMCGLNMNSLDRVVTYFVRKAVSALAQSQPKDESA